MDGNKISFQEFKKNCIILYQNINSVKSIEKKFDSNNQRDCLAMISKMLDNSFSDIDNRETKDGKEKNWGFLSSILKEIDDSIIVKSDTTMVKKAFFMNLKYNRFCDVVFHDSDFELYYNGKFMFKLSSLFLCVDVIEIQDKNLRIEGNCYLPRCVDISSMEIYVSLNDEMMQVDLVDRFSDQRYYDLVYLWQKGFSVNIPLDDNDLEIYFVNKMGREICNRTNVKFNKYSHLSNNLKKSYYYENGYVVCCKNGKIICKNCSSEKLTFYEEQFRNEICEKYPEKKEEVFLLRDFFFGWKGKKNKKKLWLFTDREDQADDNAEVFFSYVKSRKDLNKDCFFVLNKKAQDYDSVLQLGEIVEPFSLEHKRYYLIAEYVFSSHISGCSKNPFLEDELFFRDIIRSKFIWLQHGVTKDYLGKEYSKYYSGCSAIVTSAEREKDYFLKPFYHYTDSEIWLTGMPRFERLYRDEKKIISIIPTWRKALTKFKKDEKGNVKWEVIDGFNQTQFYLFFSSLLKDRELISCLDEYGYRLQFRPHYIFRDFFDKNEFDDSRVEILSNKRYSQIFAESDLLITDYSSVAFDFALLKKPIIYCQFDKAEFYSDHTMKKGYFDYKKDGFGEISYDLSSTVKLIVAYLKSGCKIKHKYLKRIENFYCGLKTDENCKKLFEKLSENKKNEDIFY